MLLQNHTFSDMAALKHTKFTVIALDQKQANEVATDAERNRWVLWPSHTKPKPRGLNLIAAHIKAYVSSTACTRSHFLHN